MCSHLTKAPQHSETATPNFTLSCFESCTFFRPTHLSARCGGLRGSGPRGHHDAGGAVAEASCEIFVRAVLLLPAFKPRVVKANLQAKLWSYTSNVVASAGESETPVGSLRPWTRRGGASSAWRRSPTCLPTYLPTYLSIYLSIYHYLSIYLSIYLFCLFISCLSPSHLSIS